MFAMVSIASLIGGGWEGKSFSSLQRLLCYLKASDLFQVCLVYLESTLLNFDWMQLFHTKDNAFQLVKKKLPCNVHVQALPISK